MKKRWSSQLTGQSPERTKVSGSGPEKSGGSNPQAAGKRLRLSAEGWTLVELMLAVALLAIVTPAMTYLFAKVSQGMAADEMHTELQQGNQNMLNRIHVRMGSSHHFFFNDNTSGGVSYLSRLAMSGSVVSGATYTFTAPPTVVGTTLSQPQTGVSGSLSSSVTDFQKAFVGNSLFFAAYDVPETITYPVSKNIAKTYNAPMTVSNASTGGPVTDSNGTQQTAIIDLYRFYYYYLTSANTKQLFDGTAYSLIEWQSIQFADYHEVANYSQDPVLEGNILAGVKALGVTVAWDPTQADPNQAFVTFGAAAFGTASTGVTALAGTTYNIPMETYTNVTRTQSGILTTGFRYGISPNSKNWMSSKVQVPLFAPVTTAGVAFPNGFEVAAGGNPTGRQIMIRSVWVAEGASAPGSKSVYNDINMVDEISDNW